MNDEKYRILDEKSISMRGAIIARTIEVEMLIDKYLSYYFCENFSRAEQLTELVLCSDRLSFNSKVEILLSLLKNNNEEFYNSNKIFVKKMLEIGPDRNVFAHSINLTHDDEGNVLDSDVIGFERFKAGKIQSKFFTEDDIKSMKDDISFLILKLIDLIKSTKLMK